MRRIALYIFAISLCSANSVFSQAGHYQEKAPFSYLDEVEDIEVEDSPFDEDDEDILSVMNSEEKYIFSLGYEGLRLANEGPYLNRVTEVANGTELVAQDLGEYKVLSSFSGTFLVKYRKSSIYFGLKARLLKAKKLDKYIYRQGTEPLTEGVDSFNDSTIDVMPGGRLLFFKGKHLRLHLATFMGITWTESDWDLVEGNTQAESDYQFTASAEIGADYMLSQSFSLGIVAGYDYRQKRKMCPKDGEASSKLTLATPFSASYVGVALSVYQ